MTSKPIVSPVPASSPPMAFQGKILVARDWLLAIILLIVLAFVWIGLGVYHVLTTTTVPPLIVEQIQPFSAVVDESVFADLSTRVVLSDQPLIEDQRVRSGESVEETPIATSAGELNLSTSL